MSAHHPDEVQQTRPLKDFGYGFNDAGVLKKLNKDGSTGNQGFEFNISLEHSVNQQNYDALGEVNKNV